MESGLERNGSGYRRPYQVTDAPPDLEAARRARELLEIRGVGEIVKKLYLGPGSKKHSPVLQGRRMRTVGERCSENSVNGTSKSGREANERHGKQRRTGCSGRESGIRAGRYQIGLRR